MWGVTSIILLLAFIYGTFEAPPITNLVILAAGFFFLLKSSTVSIALTTAWVWVWVCVCVCVCVRACVPTIMLLHYYNTLVMGRRRMYSGLSGWLRKWYQV